MPDMNDIDEEDIIPDEGYAVEKIDGSIVVDYKMLKDDVVMQSKEVAGICGIGDPQIVRNLLQQWAPLLPVKRDEKNRALWTKADIGKLQELLDVKKKHGFTVKQVLDYYLNPTPDMLGEETGMIPAGFDQNMLEEILKRVTATVTGVMERKFEEQMNLLRAEIRELKGEQRLPDEKALEEAKASLASMESSRDQYKNVAEEEVKKREQLEKALEEARSENAELKGQVEQLSKKKSFFGLFRS